MTEERKKFELGLDWSDVEEALAEDSPAGYKLAVLETDKVFRDYLERFKYLGPEPGKKTKTLGKLLNKTRELSLLQAVKEKIIEENKIDISRDDAKEIISEYWQIIKAMDEFNRRTRRAGKFRLRLGNGLFLSFLKIFAAAFAAIILGVKFFSATAAGREIISAAVRIADFLFLEILMAAGAIAIFFVIFQARKYFQKSCPNLLIYTFIPTTVYLTGWPKLTNFWTDARNWEWIQSR